MSLAAPPIPFLPARRVVSRGHHGRQRTSCAFTSRTDTRSEVSSPPVFLTLVAMRTGSPRTRRASSSSRSGTAGPIGHTLPVLNAGRSHGCRAPARAWCLASPVGHVCKKCDRAGRRGVQYLPSGLSARSDSGRFRPGPRWHAPGRRRSTNGGLPPRACSTKSCSSTSRRFVRWPSACGRGRACPTSSSTRARHSCGPTNPVGMRTAAVFTTGSLGLQRRPARQRDGGLPQVALGIQSGRLWVHKASAP